MDAKHTFRSHWISFLILVPSFILIGIHEVLGLTGAALLLRNERDRDSQVFNFVMIFVFLWSLVGCLAHALYTADRSVRWFKFKIAVIVVYYLIVLCALYCRNRIPL